MATGISLLKYQSSMLHTVFSIFLSSLKKQKVKLKKHVLRSELHNIIPHQKIVSAYHTWLNIGPRYPETIAHHLFPLWSYPTLFKLGASLNLPLHKVLNQGCKLIINSEIPVNSPLNVKVEIFNMKEYDSKYRVNQRVITQTKNCQDALIAEIYAVILKSPHSLKSEAAASMKKFNTQDMVLINEIEIREEDAKSYALISGDINPIHLSKKIARLMGLKTSIMHGFGLFALVFEELCRANLNLQEIDIRFLSPVYLNSHLKIYIKARSEDQFQLKVFSTDLSQVHLSGTFKIKRAS